MTVAMERPQSQLPAMLSSAGRTLGETSQSDINARNARDGHMPPPMSTTKHKPSNCE
jgi:hypothetical protein